MKKDDCFIQNFAGIDIRHVGVEHIHFLVDVVEIRRDFLEARLHCWRLLGVSVGASLLRFAQKG
jgi:hypothetical protein